MLKCDMMVRAIVFSAFFSMAILMALQSSVAQTLSQADLDALDKEIVSLRQAGKYLEALSLAEKHAAATRKQYGENAYEHGASLNNVAMLRQITHGYAEAEPIMRNALAILERVKGPRDPEVAIILDNLARLLQSTGRLAEAEAGYRRSISILEKAPPGDEPVLALSLSGLAEVLKSVGKLAEAEPLMRRALALNEKHLGRGDSNIDVSRNNLAQLLDAMNRTQEAERLHREAVDAYAQEFGADHPILAASLSNLAELLRSANRHEEAGALYQRVIAIIEKAYGPDHFTLPAALQNLAQTYQGANRQGEAEPLLRRALRIDEKNFGAASPLVGGRLFFLARLLEDMGRLEEAEKTHRLALSVSERAYGPHHPVVIANLTTLGFLLQKSGRLPEAENFLRRALKASEKNAGPAHPGVVVNLDNLTVLLDKAGRYSEAEPLIRRALDIETKSLGPDHPKIAERLNTLALCVNNINRTAEAERYLRRALAIDEKHFGAAHANAATRLINLALQLRKMSKLAEAERLTRRALSIDENAPQADDASISRDLITLAGLLQMTNRLADAEPLYRRALAIDEKRSGADNPDLIPRLNNLATLLSNLNRHDEAENLMRRAASICEKNYGADNPILAIIYNNIANVLMETEKYDDAEEITKKSLDINKKILGENHPNTALTLHNLAHIMQRTKRYADAEPLMRRAIGIFQKALGPRHPDIGAALHNLALTLAARGDWRAAADTHRRATPILTGAMTSGEREADNLKKAALGANSHRFRAAARAVHRAASPGKTAAHEEFELAQWALQNSAADAVSAMAARSARGDSALASLVRSQQDLLGSRETEYRSLDKAAGMADAKAASASRASIAAIDTQLDAIKKTLDKTFQNYASLANPSPLSIPEVQKLLGEGDALVLFLDMPDYESLKGETLTFAVTRRQARLLSVPLDASQLQERVGLLRCGLDASNWSAGTDSRERCKMALGAEVSEDETPLFDAQAAYALYRDLFGGIEDMIKGKSLLIVPSGALTQLPFQILVTAPPSENAPRFAAYKQAAWLGMRQALTVLPSVASLKALQSAKRSAGGDAFIGFGNPLLTGADGGDKSAWAKQDCSKAAAPAQTRISSAPSLLTSLFRGGQADLESLRRQDPLPESADELCQAARSLGVEEAALDRSVFLGARATVMQIKALSASGALAKAKVLHFATHGFVAGETVQFAQNKAEPSLLLTPPAGESANDDDNGLLTASEIAQLKLDADWVVISACNTAAGSADGAEALSGLARAFFYAGARSLLVSHWRVNSDAAVAITTGAVSAMKADPKIGRAEALRRSLSALIAKGRGYEHPSIWAPFTLVGAGV